MPIIRVEMWSGRSKEQKAELAEALTDAMVRIGNTSADHTIVIFQDIDKEDWAEAASSPRSSRRAPCGRPLPVEERRPRRPPQGNH